MTGEILEARDLAFVFICRASMWPIDILLWCIDICILGEGKALLETMGLAVAGLPTWLSIGLARAF